MSDTTKGITLAIIGPFLWGLMGIFIRPLTSAGITSIDITCMRCAIGGVLFWIILFFVNRDVLKVDFKGLIICMVYGVCSYGIGFTSYAIAVSRISVAIATVLMFTAPVMVVILNAIIFRDKPKKSHVIAIILCFIGAILAADVIHAYTGQPLDALGIIMSFVNALGMSTQLIIPRFFHGQFKKDTMIVYGFIGTSLAAAIFADFGRIETVLHNGDTATLVGCILAMGILCTLCSNGAYVKSSQYIDTVSVSILSATEVVVGIVVSYVVFHESMIPLQWLGAIIIVIGALYPNILIKYNERRHPERL